MPVEPTTRAQVLQIATTQTEVTNGAVGHVTEYDRNITHLFNKQTKVSQTIANLLAIIRKGTANRNQAQTDITAYKAKYDEAVLAQEDISLLIAQKETKVSNIKGSIAAIEGEIKVLKGEHMDVGNKIRDTKDSGLSLNHELNVALSQKDGLNVQIGSTQATIDSLSARLDSHSQNCE